LSLPALEPLARSPECFAKRSGASSAPAQPRILFSERDSAPPLRGVVARIPAQTARALTIAIGPEGGWTNEEFGVAIASEFSEASLGSTILRVETAVVTALAALNYALGG
jgi:16S rRNA (uracil1498-N3)-methyltransferase